MAHIDSRRFSPFTLHPSLVGFGGFVMGFHKVFFIIEISNPYPYCPFFVPSGVGFMMGLCPVCFYCDRSMSCLSSLSQLKNHV